MTKGLVTNCDIDSYELRYRATSEAFCKLLFFFCVLSKSLITCQQLRPIGSYQLKTKAVSLPPPPPTPPHPPPLINPSGCQYYSLRYAVSVY